MKLYKKIKHEQTSATLAIRASLSDPFDGVKITTTINRSGAFLRFARQYFEEDVSNTAYIYVDITNLRDLKSAIDTIESNFIDSENKLFIKRQRAQTALEVLGFSDE